MAQVYHTEEVKEGQKANWPNDPNYENEKPVKEGYALKGWDYDWESNPIFEDTDIHPIWDKVTMQASTNVNGEISYEGDDLEDLGEFTELAFWASTASGDSVHDGIEFEEMPLEQGESLRIDFIDYGDIVKNGINIKQIKVKPNPDYEPRFYRFRASTQNYGGMVSETIVLKQSERVNVYVLESQNMLNKLTVPIDEGTINLSGYISTLNNEFYDDLTFESEVPWIQPTGVVTRPSPDGNVALIQANVQSLSIGQENEGRRTTIVVRQNGGLSANLDIEQILPQTTSQLTFILVNNSSNNISFSTIHVNLSNGRSFTFSPSQNNVGSGESFTYQTEVNVYFLNKELNPTTPLQGSINSGIVVNPIYLSINTTLLSQNGTYTITYSPNVNNNNADETIFTE